MYANRFRAAVLALAAGLGVSACTYGNGYGYSGLSLGYNSGGYYDDGFYGGGLGYDGYGYGGTFGAPYWGWYGDYYYPGAGYYVYDRNRRPFRWNDRQRTYWQNRYSGWRGTRPGDRPNWDGFERRPGSIRVPDISMFRAAAASITTMGGAAVVLTSIGIEVDGSIGNTAPKVAQTDSSEHRGPRSTDGQTDSARPMVNARHAGGNIPPANPTGSDQATVRVRTSAMEMNDSTATPS